MIQAWYDDCRDGYPWWRITGQAYRKYFSVPAGGTVEGLEEAIAQELVLSGVRALTIRFGVTGRTILQRAHKLGYRPIGTTGRWIAPGEVA